MDFPLTQMVNTHLLLMAPDGKGDGGGSSGPGSYNVMGGSSIGLRSSRKAGGGSGPGGPRGGKLGSGVSGEWGRQ
jgi:hypothetical protein